MPRCLYDHCLVLLHSSYLLMLLPPPLVSSQVPILGQCELRYSGHCHVAHCHVAQWKCLYLFYDDTRYLNHGFIYPVCLSKHVNSLSWPSVCIRLIFFRLFDANVFTLVLTVLHISAYSVRCRFHPPFVVVSSQRLKCVFLLSLII